MSESVWKSPEFNEQQAIAQFHEIRKKVLELKGQADQGATTLEEYRALGRQLNNLRLALNTQVNSKRASDITVRLAGDTSSLLNEMGGTVKQLEAAVKQKLEDDKPLPPMTLGEFRKLVAAQIDQQLTQLQQEGEPALPAQPSKPEPLKALKPLGAPTAHSPSATPQITAPDWMAGILDESAMDSQPPVPSVLQPQGETYTPPPLPPGWNSDRFTVNPLPNASGVGSSETPTVAARRTIPLERIVAPTSRPAATEIPATAAPDTGEEPEEADESAKDRWGWIKKFPGSAEKTGELVGKLLAGLKRKTEASKGQRATAHAPEASHTPPVIPPVLRARPTPPMTTPLPRVEGSHSSTSALQPETFRATSRRFGEARTDQPPTVVQPGKPADALRSPTTRAPEPPSSPTTSKPKDQSNRL